MFTREDNELLTRVAPGTPMGALLREYWTPACLTSEIAEPGSAPLRVRLFGEDLIALRESEGAVGLVAERCPHRQAPLFFSRNAAVALRDDGTVPPGVDDPELYRVRPAGAVLSRGADWLAETRALQEGRR